MVPSATTLVTVSAHLLGVLALQQLYSGGWTGIAKITNATTVVNSGARLADIVPDGLLQLQIGTALQWAVLTGSLLYVVYVLYRAYHLIFGRVVIVYNMLDRDINHRVTSGRTKKDVANIARKLRQRGEIPPVYPNSWYEVMRSEEVPIGGVKAISMIGQQLAVFRRENGQISVVDAYCPHLGAHLGVGGIVRGNCIECPFHSWQFDGETGQCTKIPYASKVPNFAKVKVWHTIEVNGIIFLWFDAEGRDPSYFPEDFSEVRKGKWTYRGHTVHYVNCHIQDILENGADLQHLHSLHKAGIAAGTGVEFNRSKWLGQFLTHHWDVKWQALDPPLSHIGRMTLKLQNMLFDRWPLNPLNFHVVVDQVGPGIVVLKFKLLLGEGVFIQTIVPEGPLQQRLTHYIYCDRWIPTFVAAYLLLKGDATQIERDAIVWSHKTFKSKPLLVREDQLILSFRRWISQFYSENSPRLTLRQEQEDLCF